MHRKSCCGAAVAAAAILSATLASAPALAAATDYRFELVSAHATGTDKADVTLPLIHVPDGKPVPGAVIFQPRAVMAGMESMPADATVEPGQQPGTYLLHVTPIMTGSWTLRVAAKVQGEAETVHAAVPFEAGK